MRIRALLAALLGLALAAPCLGCRHQGDSVVLAGDGSRLSSEEIDKDPLALLPSAPLGVAYVDAKAAFDSQVGSSVASLVSVLLPLGPEANFEPKRDIEKAYVGFYSLEGADMAAVIQGNFDPNAIQSAASRGTPTVLGPPLTRLQYAGNDLYIAGGVGFVVVTKRTLVAGNDTGIRRVLDRIRDKRLKRDVPEWIAQLIDTPKAAIVGAADLTTQAQNAALVAQLPFLNGLKVVRVLGNLQPPGVNFAGAASYPDANSAAQSAATLQQLAQLAAYASLLSFLGIRPPLQDIQVRTEQNDVQFIASMDSQSVATVTELLARTLRAAKPQKP